MNILAIDYGKKRIGLAWVQSGLDVILPFGVINADNALSDVSALIVEERIDEVVIGLPKALSGEQGQMEVKVRDFGRAIGESTGKFVTYIDERFTSAEADSMGGTVSRDERAAMLILDTYIRRNKS
jgi:putative holliday junction resolvase